ncbi:BPSS1780 family membrane protein [Xenophilus arseniciresistens]|uniref:BPSS1780 family membrane protein n=1 Tax=Xenophilus arseniciresistens TaxID=1283306 RepID=A0AAE3N958_9BURK|nr:BPSS1780 family membrane protein [Xenophilus arseniciresistens]MDA7416606.1 BPSS1780 family membrane protein [Xenophilus arseniciresistens]
MKLLVVAPGTGARWVREGLLAFRRAPMAFFSLFMIFMAAMALVAALPLVGVPLAVALGPASTLAIMVASETVAQPGAAIPLLRPGQPTPPLSARVFMAALGAVREKARSLAIMGALYAVAVLLIGALASLLVGDPMADAINSDGTFKADVVRSGAFQGAMVLRMLIYVPVALAFWHAPALLHWHGVPPVKALFFSFVTCVRNIGAMLVFILCWTGVALLVSLVLAMVGSLLASVAGPLGAGVMVGGTFLLSAMFFASAWFSFRDCFQAD